MKGTKNKPKLRFPEFTEAWEQRKFSDLVQIERGGSPRPIDDFITNSPDGLNWVKIGDAPAQGNRITKTAEKIRPEGLSKTREVHPGDLILSNSMSFGKPYIMGIDGCIHDGWLLIRNTNNIFDLTFLCHLLGTPQMLNQYRSLAAGSTVNNLNKELVGNTVVTIPKIGEQRVLGQYLEHLDRLITLHQRKLEKIKEIKKGLMQKLFSQEVRFKADDGSEFPEWEEKKLGDVGDIMTGNTPSTKQEDYYGGCYLWITPTDITDSREVSSTAKRLTELGYAVARHIPANSVLVTCIASIGKNAIMRENGSCNQQINSITPYDDYSVEFIYYLICQNEKLLHANAGTGGMEILNKDSFSKIKMCFPCLAEQQKIADCISSLDEVIEKQKATLAAWEELKKGLLQQMFI